MTSNGYEPRARYEHLVVPLDGSAEAERAVALGKMLADASGAKLHLLHVESQWEKREAGVFLQAQEMAAKIGALAEVRPSGPDELPPGEVIHRYLEELGNATAVMATHGRGRLATALVGSVTAGVISSGHAVVALGPNVPAGTDPITRVLACVDASSFSETVVAEAAGWATALGAQLWLVEVVNPKEAPAAAVVQESSYVHRLAKELQATGLAIEWEVLHDERPGRAIATYAATQPGTLVALATHGRSGLRRAIVGSVAGDVLHAATVPVVVLQPQG